MLPEDSVLETGDGIATGFGVVNEASAADGGDDPSPPFWESGLAGASIFLPSVGRPRQLPIVTRYTYTSLFQLKLFYPQHDVIHWL